MENKVIIFALLVDNEGKLSASFNPPVQGFNNDDIKTIFRALKQSAREVLKFRKANETPAQ